MGFAKVFDPVVPLLLYLHFFNTKQATHFKITAYNRNVPYGFKIGNHFEDNELHTNLALFNTYTSCSDNGCHARL